MPKHLFWLSMLVTSLVMVFIEGGRRSGDEIPIPFLLLYASVVLAANLAGLWAGLVSALIVAGYINYAASISFGPPTLTGGPIQVTLGIALYAMTAYLLGRTKSQNVALLQEMQDHQAALETLIAARTADLMAANQALRQEIAERSQAEADLRKSERRYQDFYENAPVAYLSLSVDGLIRDCNQKALELLGYPHPENLLGRSMLDLYADTPYGKAKAAVIAERFRAGQPIALERVQMQRRDGSIMWGSLTVNAVRDNAGHIVQSRSTFVDISDQVQAEQKLQQSEAHFRSLQQNAEGFAIYRSKIVQDDVKSSQVIFVSPSIREIMGVTDPENMSAWFEKVHPGDLPRALQQQRDSVRHNIPFNQQMRIYHPLRQAWRWVQIISNPVLNNSDEHTYFNGIIIDITAQMQAEQALRKSEARYRAIVEVQSELVTRSTPDHILTFVNEAYCRFIGRSPEDLIGQSYLQFIPPGSRQMVRDKIVSLTPEHPLLSQEHPEHRADGTLRWLNWTDRGIFDEHGQLVEVQAVGRDVTNRRQVEEVLRKSEARYRAVVEDQTELISRATPDQVLTFVNKAYCRFFGRSSEELIGQSFLQFVPPENHQALRKKFASLTPENPVVSDENPELSADGSLRWLQWTDRGIFDESGKLVEVQAVGWDVTHRRLAEEAMQRYTQRLATLHQIDRAILSAQSPEEIAGAALTQLARLVPCQRADVSLFDPDLQTVERLAAFSRGRLSSGPAVRLPVTETLLDLDRLSQGKLHQVEDYLVLDHLPAQLHDIIAQEGSRASIAAPFISEGNLVGLLGLGRREPGLFTAEETQIIREVADQLAIAITNARLLTETRQRLQELTTLYQAGLAFTKLLDPATLGQQVIEVIEQQLGYQRTAIFSLSPEGDLQLLAHSTLGLGPEAFQTELERVRRLIQPNQGISSWVARHGQPVRLGDVRQDPRYVVGDPAIRSELCVPLLVSGRSIGSLNVESDQPNAFTEHDERLLTILAGQAAVALENARLFEQIQHHAEELEQHVAERTSELKEQYQRQATLEERQRLARDLHDAVSQTLFSASLLAEAIPRIWERHPGQALESLADLYRLNRGALAEMRNLLLELRPAVLAESNLADLLRQLADVLAGRTRLAISLAIEDGETQLPVDTKIAIFRIAQEALNNIIKHAQAEVVWINLRHQPDQLCLTISDDGHGFDLPYGAPGRFGLKNMHERAEAIGATLHINSRPNQGTEIELIWPAVE